ncbi:MAG: molybdopterin-dependent oxidoreductase [Hyphomicrobiales bacterium]
MLDEHIVKTTCTRDCYDACGIAAYTQDGVITKVLGDPDHAISRGKLCGKCAIAYNGAWLDHGLRLTTPLRRLDAKGSGSFVAISWDEALAEIAARFRALIDAGEAHTILHTHYTGTVGQIAGAFPIRLFNRMGATEVDPDTVCNKAGHAALELAFGSSVDGFDPRTIADSRTLLIWGANPSFAAPHQDAVFVRKAAEAGTKIIVVDPLAHDTAAAADIHLKLRPGADSALAFAFLNVMRAKRLVDRAFLDAHVLGADELDAGIEEMTPERAAALCGVPAALIEEAAVAYATGPSLLWLGQGAQRQTHGGNTFRALAALVAFSGNLGKPGAGFLYMNGTGSRGIDADMVAMPELARDGTRSISHMDLAPTLEDSSSSKVLVNWNNNPAASSPQQRRLRKALEREDLFHVAIDLFHTDTTAYADIVLPAANFLECNDLILSYFDLTLSAVVKAAEPPGEALPNHEIFRRLARAMGYNDAELFETEGHLIDRLLRATPYAGRFADLAGAGTVTLFAAPQVQFADLKFATPSGRIELASDAAEALGLPRAPQPYADAMPKAGSFRIVSPASEWQMNSSYGNDPVIRRRLGPPTVTLHPDDAAAFGFLEGDDVVIVNDEGRLPLAVTISERAQPGVGIIYKGRWPSASSSDANINVLVSGRKTDLAESTTVHSTVVRLERA